MAADASFVLARIALVRLGLVHSHRARSKLIVPL